jgi:hypothetical protein
MVAAAVAWRCRRLSWFIPFLCGWSWLNYEAAAAFRTLVPAVAIAPAVRQLPPSAGLIGFGYEDAALVFYTERIWRWEPDLQTAQAELVSPGRRCAVLLRREVRLDRSFLEHLRQGRGFDEMVLLHDNRERIRGFPAEGYRQFRVVGVSIARRSLVELEVLVR